MFESRKICSTFGALVDILCAPTNSHNRRWNAQTKSNRCDEWCPTFSKDNASYWLQQHIEIWSKKGIFLSISWQWSHKMFRKIKRQTISTDGRSCAEAPTKVSNDFDNLKVTLIAKIQILFVIYFQILSKSQYGTSEIIEKAGITSDTSMVEKWIIDDNITKRFTYGSINKKPNEIINISLSGQSSVRLCAFIVFN